MLEDQLFEKLIHVATESSSDLSLLKESYCRARLSCQELRRSERTGRPSCHSPNELIHLAVDNGCLHSGERWPDTLAVCSTASEGPAVLRGWKQSLIRPSDLIIHVEEAQGTEVTPYDPTGSKRDGEGTHLLYRRNLKEIKTILRTTPVIFGTGMIH